MRSVLPDWTLEPLKLAGMSAREIDTMVATASATERQCGIADLEAEVDQLDQQIEEAENQLIGLPHKSIECIGSLLRLAVDRLRRQVSTDPNDVFYDYGEARVMFMLEQVVDDLRDQVGATQLAAG